MHLMLQQAKKAQELEKETATRYTKISIDFEHKS